MNTLIKALQEIIREETAAHPRIEPFLASQDRAALTPEEKTKLYQEHWEIFAAWWKSAGGYKVPTSNFRPEWRWFRRDNSI